MHDQSGGHDAARGRGRWDVDWEVGERRRRRGGLKEAGTHLSQIEREKLKSRFSRDARVLRTPVFYLTQPQVNFATPRSPHFM